jgi:uncharacterized membrane protein YkgB
MSIVEIGKRLAQRHQGNSEIPDLVLRLLIGDMADISNDRRTGCKIDSPIVQWLVIRMDACRLMIRTPARQLTQGEVTMNPVPSGRAVDTQQHGPTCSTDFSQGAKSALTRLATWVSDRDLPFLVTSVGMIVMLLWAGSFKLTAPGAEGIAPLVYHSPLIWWHFKIFGPYVGSDIIGLTEFTAAILFIAGYVRPKVGIVGGLITTVMFFTTSSMLITTPGTTISVPGIPGMRFMNLLGLFLYKDVIALGASLYLISHFGKRAGLSESERQ